MRNNLALKTLFVVNSIYVLAATLLGPLYAVYVQRLGGGIMLISVSTAVFYVTSTLFLVFVARWGDRVKEKEHLLAISYAVRGIAFWGYMVVSSGLMLILIQVMLGFAEALGTPTFSALFAKHLDKKEEVLEYSDWSMVANLVIAMGSILGGFIVTALGFGFLFGIIGGLCLLSSLIVWLTPRKVL